MSLLNRITTGSWKIYRQRPWTDQELVADGFHYYRPVKRVTMARPLPASEAPKTIVTPWDTIVATAGYMIAYVAGEELKASLDEYEPRPIEPDIFKTTYKLWDDRTWKPSQTERHLIQLGCKPYYKMVGVWAKKLAQSTLVRSMESPRPSVAPAGAWLCIGVAGEPWSVTDEWFHTRYLVENASTR